MSPDGAYRLEDILALLGEEELRALADNLECRDTISAVRDLLLGNDAIARALAALDADSFAALHHVANVVPPLIPAGEPLSVPLEGLIAKGLAFVLAMQGEQRLHIPLEIQIEVNESSQLSDPDLRLLLFNLDDESIDRLALTYQNEQVDEDDSPDELSHICRLADAMESPSTLREIYQHLPTAAQEVLGWTCEHGGPLGTEEVRSLARDAADYHDERFGVAVDQLVRFGLLLSLELDDSNDVLLVPRSLRNAILGLLDQTLTTQCASVYETLTALGHLSFPDEGPHGWGGDALRSMRQLLVNWIAGRIERLPPEYGVAVGTQILDPDRHSPGTFASLLLDLSGETAFSRQALRLWLALVDDPWTMDLIQSAGGDPARLVKFFSVERPEGVDEDAEVWFGHLFLVRAQLVLSLSLLAPGKWFPIGALARLFHLLLARSTIANLSQERLSAQFPYEALPDYGVILARPDRLVQVRDWLEGWLLEFASVIGAAEVDSSVSYFRVHPDAFCVFRDSDLWFRTVWDDLAPIVGDDLDIWMPIPNDPGPRISGVAEIWDSGGARVALERHSHLYDLTRLAQWAEPFPEPDGYGFAFTAESTASSLDRGLDGEEMLVWLAARTGGEISPALRGLFPQSNSTVDGPPSSWKKAATERVEELLMTLENWGSSPPSRLLEELRSWGRAAVPLLESRLADLQGKDRSSEPIVTHICVLLGELNAISAISALIDILLTAESEIPQHAAAAALMRIGSPALDDLTNLLSNSEVPRDRRLMIAMTLTGIATLHPHTYDTVADTLVKVIGANSFDGDLQTRLTLELCRTGHPRAESIVDELSSEGIWMSEDWRPEDALWLVRVSPCVWGSLLFSTPMAMLYLVSDEAEELAQEAGVRDLLSSAGLSSERVLYGRPRPRRGDS